MNWALTLLCLEFQCLWFLADVCFQLSLRHHPGGMNSFLAATPSSLKPPSPPFRVQ